MRWLFVVLATVLLAPFAASDQDRDAALWHHRNLGKAFYENPTTQAQAVDEFRKALQLNPNSPREQLNYGLALLRAGKTAEAVAQLEKVQKLHPELPHTYFNLGIVFKKQGEFGKALPQFEKMVQLVPDEPVSHYNLGVLYKQENRLSDAIRQFEIAAALNHNLAAPHFQLYNVYRSTGRGEMALRELQEFQRLKKAQEGAAIPEDMEWCDYAEIYDPPDARPLQPAGQPRYALRNFAQRVDGWLIFDYDNDGRPDVLAWRGGALTLYRGGTDVVRESGLDALGGIIAAAAGDFDNDGLMDLCVLGEQGPTLLHNDKGRFTLRAASLPRRRFEKAIWLDYDHDYDLDLLLLGENSVLLRNQGAAGFEDHTSDLPLIPGRAVDGGVFRINPDSKAFDVWVRYSDRPPVVYRDLLGGRYVVDRNVKAEPTSVSNIDFDGDGRIDRVTPEGVEFNRSANSNWLRVALTGVKNLKLGQGSLVEVKAGTLYARAFYDGYPLTFNLHNYSEADTVRITWPNGLIQNEIRQATNKAYTYKEAQRLSGSCPMIWTWNGREFQFITDVLGVAPLGARSGDSSYFPIDHDEYVQIPGEAMALRNGQYELHITEELAEVSYIDQTQLVAVDHPAAQDLFINERWKSPPYPALKFYGGSRRIHPVAAHDNHGHDVLSRITWKDRTYVDDFRRSELGASELHSLTLDFGRAPRSAHRAVLILNGWVDWADGSTFLAASQESKGGLIAPYLQARDASGKWVTIDSDMGMPDGKPKTIAVEVNFPSDRRELRIVTNLCVYWDEIFLLESSAPPVMRKSFLRAASADLHFRGFSATRIDPARKQPDQFIYSSVTPLSFWNPTPGYYTRYGDVRELLEAVDDRYVIMGSGDEITLRFDAGKLPPLPSGWKRDFLLKVDGWAKDRDANTAFSQTVEPLPFHGMSAYPYPVGEQYPKDTIHRKYRERYNTRPALVLIRPLVANRLGSGQ
jgi:Flp pilus assembly protein TadD